ncbi:polysaccharide lyase family 8 super-sandwich domain-containing protein [Brachybacterium sp. AOP35-5H-19]
MIPRRAMLTGTGTAVALGAFFLGSSPAYTPLPERPPTLQERWVEAITARARILHPSRRMRDHLAEMDSDVRGHLRSADEASGGNVFTAYPLDGEDSSALSGTATWLATMARAWSTPGSDFSHDERLRTVLLDGVAQLLDGGYHDGAENYDNWWDWEVGTPRALADVMCLLRDELPGHLLENAGAAIRYFIPDPTYSEIMNYPTTGSNRVNTIRGALIAAVAEEDDARIRECVDALPDAWRIVDDLDGFYADGGFIQHIDIPYTGNYGSDLLQTLAPILTLLEGTEFDIEEREELWDLVDSAYLPVMVNGHVLDGMRGRAVARTQTNGSVTGRNLVGAIAEIARTAPARRRERWMDTFRWWASQNPTVDLLAGADLPGAVALHPATQGRAAPAASSSVYFASMDRLVHRADGWTVALSMCSERIAAYEATEAENTSGVLTGNRMRYLFINDDPAPFDDYFWSTLDYARPPGTTNHRTAFDPEPTRQSSANRPMNEWTGGLLYGELSIAAMHQVNRGGEAPECRHLTVATAHEVVELVSDIRSTLNTFTTVENRMFPDGARAELLVDGQRVGSSASVADARWAHVEGVGGYVFPGGATLEASISRRVGSTRRVEQKVEDIPRGELVAREWATLDLQHPERTHAAWWVLLPTAGVAETEAASSAISSHDPRVRVVRNDATAQIVRLEGITMAAAIWIDAVVELTASISIRCQHPVLLAAERAADGLVLRLTDPTQSRERTEVIVSGEWALNGAEDIDPDAVAVRVENGGSRVTASIRGRGGRAFTVHLTPA